MLEIMAFVAIAGVVVIIAMDIRATRKMLKTIIDDMVEILEREQGEPLKQDQRLAVEQHMTKKINDNPREAKQIAIRLKEKLNETSPV